MRVSTDTTHVLHEGVCACVRVRFSFFFSSFASLGETFME